MRRMLGQSLGREFHPKGTHAVHVIVDGQIDTPNLAPETQIVLLKQSFTLPKSSYSRSNKRPIIGTYELDPRPHLSRSESYAGTF